MFGRLVKVFTNPRDYWNEMVAEPGDIKSLLVPQILILAAVPALAQFLGMILGGLGLALKLGFFGRIVAGAIVSLVLGYALNIVAWIVLGYIINGLAPSFDGQKDLNQSMKLAMGAIVPMWLGSVLHLTTLSALGLLGSLAGLGYGAYFLYLGLPIMNGTPQEKAVGYTAASIAILFGVMLVIGLLTYCPATCLMASAMMPRF